jgi:hypothetical protein
VRNGIRDIVPYQGQYGDAFVEFRNFLHAPSQNTRDSAAECYAEVANVQKYGKSFADSCKYTIQGKQWVYVSIPKSKECCVFYAFRPGPTGEDDIIILGLCMEQDMLQFFSNVVSRLSEAIP